MAKSPAWGGLCQFLLPRRPSSPPPQACRMVQPTGQSTFLLPAFLLPLLPAPKFPSCPPFSSKPHFSLPHPDSGEILSLSYVAKMLLSLNCHKTSPGAAIFNASILQVQTSSWETKLPDETLIWTPPCLTGQSSNWFSHPWLSDIKNHLSSVQS